jgi:L-aspartate oxidase
MRRHDPRGELAPRDIVARAIHRQRRTGGGAFLDCRAAVGDHVPEAFPAVFAACMAHGLDPRREPIPVAPAAHYHMGGVETDASGATSVAGLFAAGECASTGVHGANRLASNSLLEAAVFGRRAGLAAAAFADPGTSPLPATTAPDLPAAALADLRRTLSREVGVERDAAGLGRALALIERLAAVHGEAPTLTTARLIVDGALARRESRGAHFRTDHPAESADPRSSRVRHAAADRIEA